MHVKFSRGNSLSYWHDLENDSTCLKATFAISVVTVLVEA